VIIECYSLVGDCATNQNILITIVVIRVDFPYNFLCRKTPRLWTTMVDNFFEVPPSENYLKYVLLGQYYWSETLVELRVHCNRRMCISNIGFGIQFWTRQSVKNYVHNLMSHPVAQGLSTTGGSHPHLLSGP
jgi:hypothetical protein